MKRTSHTTKRAGFTLVELMVTGGLLVTLGTMVLPSFHWVTVQQRAASEEQAALEELSGLLEVTTLKPYEELTAESLNDLKISDELRALLTEAKLTTKLTDAEDARRLTLKLTWTTRGAPDPVSVQLSTWVYPQNKEDE